MQLINCLRDLVNLLNIVLKYTQILKQLVFNEEIPKQLKHSHEFQANTKSFSETTPSARKQ